MSEVALKVVLNGSVFSNLIIQYERHWCNSFKTGQDLNSEFYKLHLWVFFLDKQFYILRQKHCLLSTRGCQLLMGSESKTFSKGTLVHYLKFKPH